MQSEYDLDKLSCRKNPYYSNLVYTIELSEDNYNFYSAISKKKSKDIAEIINEILVKNRSIIELNN